MYSLWNNKNIYKAVAFATNAFNKKYPVWNKDEKNYLAHLMCVAFNALNYSIHEDVDKEFLIKVALLHDVLEDTDVTYTELLEEFGVKVAKAVKALSRNDQIKYDMQIPDCLNRIKSEPKEVAIVKMADRLYNIRERFSEWSLEHLEKYKQEAQLICDELGMYCENMRQALQLAIDEY